MKKKFIFSGVVLILCLPLCVVVGWLYSFSIPREYYSKVTIEVEVENYRLGVFAEGKFDAIDNSDFEPTQFQIIRSHDTIYPVIDELKLGQKWTGGTAQLSKEQIYSRLLKMMQIKHIPGTGFLEIGVYSRDPQEAADIVNAIGAQYRKSHSDDQKKMYGLNLSELKDEVEKQRQKVESAHAEMLKIRERVQTDAYDPNPAVVRTPTPEERQLSEEYVAAKTRYNQAKKDFDSAETRYVTQKMELRIRFQPTKIWEKAEPATLPARPNVPMILLVSTGIGLLFAIPGAVLLVVGLCMKDSTPGRGI